MQAVFSPDVNEFEVFQSVERRYSLDETFCKRQWRINVAWHHRRIAFPWRLFTSLAAFGVYVRLEVPLSVDTVSYKRYSDSYDYSVFGIFITTGFSLAVNLLTLLSFLN
jgi:hypothetical protein